MFTEFQEIILLSLRVSGIALLFSTLIGVPLGAFLGLTRFSGRRLVIALLYTGMGFPPVVIGLFVYLMLSRSGPLGALKWDWLPDTVHNRCDDRGSDHHLVSACAGFTMAAVMGVDPQLRQQVTRWRDKRQAAWMILKHVVSSFRSSPASAASSRRSAR
jgi:tungstate transport system permease protein